MNLVLLTGRLTAKPEFNEANNLAQVSLALNSRYKDQEGNWIEKVEYYNCTAFGQIGKNISSATSKGDLIEIRAHLSISKKNEDDKKTTYTNIIIDSFDVLVFTKRD